LPENVMRAPFEMPLPGAVLRHVAAELCWPWRFRHPRHGSAVGRRVLGESHKRHEVGNVLVATSHRPDDRLDSMVDDAFVLVVFR
jgi:hypothetical protein